MGDLIIFKCKTRFAAMFLPIVQTKLQVLAMTFMHVTYERGKTSAQNRFASNKKMRRCGQQDVKGWTLYSFRWWMYYALTDIQTRRENLKVLPWHGSNRKCHMLSWDLLSYAWEARDVQKELPWNLVNVIFKCKKVNESLRCVLVFFIHLPTTSTIFLWFNILGLAVRNVYWKEPYYWSQMQGKKLIWMICSYLILLSKSKD